MMPTNAFAAGAYAATQGLLSPTPRPSAGKAASAADFKSLLDGGLEGVAEAAKGAEAQMVAAANGKADIVDVVTAVAESEAALETLVAVRDRVIAAYEEIMRMPI
jgi:flagellar hook-basal body complex protein FliE